MKVLVTELIWPEGLRELQASGEVEYDSDSTSCGGVVNEADLAEALDEGPVGGAVLDVLESEPPQADNPLLAHDRVVLTPHVAGLTEEAQVNTSVLVAHEVTKVLRGQPSLCVAG